MAYTDRTATYALILRLLEKPHGFDFYQAARRLECAQGPGPRIGTSIRLKDDPVRFGQAPELAFPTSTVRSYESRSRPGTTSGGTADRLNINFMGLFGPNGALPLHLTEYARERIRHSRDAGFHRFCDIFHHRMISLFYRAWAVNQPTISFDRIAIDPDSDRFGFYTSAIIGRSTGGLLRRDALPDIAKQHFAGRLAMQAKPPEGIERVVADYFVVPCEMREFQGRWVDLPPGSTLKLGASRATGQLGRSAIVGSRVWDLSQAFRLVVGPIGLAQYLRFLPGAGRTFARVVAWVRNYVGYEFDWDLQVYIKKDEVPATQLGGAPSGGAPPLLGWTTWLKSDPAKPMDEDRGDLVLRAPDEARSGMM